MLSLHTTFLHTMAILLFILSTWSPSSAQQTTIPDLNKLEPPCGQRLTVWKGDNSMDHQAFDLVMARLNALPPNDSPDSFYKATKAVYNDISFGFAMIFADRMVLFFDDKNFKKDVYQKSLSRFKSTPKAEVEKWFTDMRRLAQMSESENLNAMIAWELTAIEILYIQDKYAPQNAQKYLSRLKQLQPEHLDLWSDSLPAFRSSYSSSDKEDKRIESALAIVQIDAFFPNERFDGDKLKNAIDKARKAR